MILWSRLFRCTVRVMASTIRFRRAMLLALIVSCLCGRPLQQRSEADQAAELKRRVIETLQLRVGDTAADVGCGDGFFTIPLARFLGPSGKVYAEDVDDAALLKLREHLEKEGLQNVEIIKGVVIARTGATLSNGHEAPVIARP